MSSQPKELNQFWLDVATAHAHVATDHSKEFGVARNGYEAVIKWRSDDLPPYGFVQIHIREAITQSQEPLTSP